MSTREFDRPVHLGVADDEVDLSRMHVKTDRVSSRATNPIPLSRTLTRRVSLQRAMTVEETQDKLQANIFKGWKVSIRLRVFAHGAARLI